MKNSGYGRLSVDGVVWMTFPHPGYSLEKMNDVMYMYTSVYALLAKTVRYVQNINLSDP